jgi:hypothetical protein
MILAMKKQDSSAKKIAVIRFMCYLLKGNVEKLTISPIV